MGDFTLHHEARLPPAKLTAAHACLARQGSRNPVTARHGGYVVHFFPKQCSPVVNVHQDAGGDFCGSSGTFIYKGKMGEDALSALLTDFSPDAYHPEDFNGLFTVILRKGDRLFLLTDPMGGNRVYQNEAAGFWSSSFLATAETAARLTPNPQAIYEYAFQETTYGADTAFREVTSLSSLKIFEFTARGLVSRNKNLNFTYQPSSAPAGDLIAHARLLLNGVVAPVTALYGDRIRTALSGGYDSRLMLALLRDNGATPEVYVYGPDSSPDVRVARTISRGEDFALHHIDKGAYAAPGPADYPAVVRDIFLALDGLPGEGIFDFGANMDTRRRRAGGGHITFNGGGGEIFRNFFYLPETRPFGGDFTVSDLIDTFYSRYTTALCTPAFDETAYRATLHDKLMTALCVTSDRLRRSQVEYAYPAFRLRYWTARDNNNNCRLGSYLTPFISYPVIRMALGIPLALKNHGRFQADLIRAVSPALAAYPSDYGYAFDRPAPVKARLKNYLTYLRPTSLRRHSYALQHKWRELSRPAPLAPERLDPLFPDGLPHMSAYFKVDQVRDAALLGRIYTLEYLFRHFGL